MAVLEVCDVSICYITGDFKDIGLKEFVVRKLKGNYHVNEFWADRHVTFSLEKGDMLGIIGTNGAGKSTLLKAVWEQLKNRTGICAAYMPQNYADLLDLEKTPVDCICINGDAEERTMVRTFLGALRFTTAEMDHPAAALSGGQQAKIFLLRLNLSGANVLLLDEPTRNFSPLSGPVIRRMLAAFPGAILSVSHDRKYIEEVCTEVYALTRDGLVKR